jgi:hypothetical protein
VRKVELHEALISVPTRDCKPVSDRITVTSRYDWHEIGAIRETSVSTHGQTCPTEIKSTN